MTIRSSPKLATISTRPPSAATYVATVPKFVRVSSPCSTADTRRCDTCIASATSVWVRPKDLRISARR
jgi:hypothetical protein